MNSEAPLIAETTEYARNMNAEADPELNSCAIHYIIARKWKSSLMEDDQECL